MYTETLISLSNVEQADDTEIKDQLESNLETTVIEDQTFFECQFKKDFKSTVTDIIYLANTALKDILSLCDLLYLDPSQSASHQVIHVSALKDTFMDSLIDFLSESEELTTNNAQIFLAKALQNYLSNFEDYINLVQSKSSASSKPFIISASLIKDYKANYSILAKLVRLTAVETEIHLANNTSYKIEEQLQAGKTTALPHSVLRAPHGRVIEAIFYRDTGFCGEDRYWMEQMKFLTEQADSLQKFKEGYDEKYEQQWIPEFYTAQNFRNVWYSACHKFSSSQEASGIVDNDFKSAATKIYESMMKGNANAVTMIDFTFKCEKEKYNIYPIIYTYKVHAEVLRIAQNNIEEQKLSDSDIKDIKQKVLDLYDTEEKISAIYKLMCQSCHNSYVYSDDVFSIICYFLNNLMEVRPKSLQDKLMVLFEKRAYSQKFFKQIHTSYIIDHIKKLNSGNFIEIYSRQTGTVTSASYLIDQNSEKQVLRFVNLLACSQDPQVREYLLKQRFSDKSYDLVEATLEYAKALLPYMYYSVTFDTLHMCLETIHNLIGNSAEGDSIRARVVEKDFVSIAEAVLNLNSFSTSEDKKGKISTLSEAVVHNFKLISNCSYQLSCSENQKVILSWLYQKQKAPKGICCQEFALLSDISSFESIKTTNLRLGQLKQKILTQYCTLMKE